MGIMDMNMDMVIPKLPQQPVVPMRMACMQAMICTVGDIGYNYGYYGYEYEYGDTQISATAGSANAYGLYAGNNLTVGDIGYNYGYKVYMVIPKLPQQPVVPMRMACMQAMI